MFPTKGLLSLLLPQSCAGCGGALEAEPRQPLCEPCAGMLFPSRPPWCGRCGVSLVGSGAGVTLCLPCRLRRRAFERAVSPFLYQETAQRMIHSFKYGGRLSLARFFAQRMSECVLSALGPAPVDVCVPVPLHPTRMRERGYNQAQVLARELSRLLAIPLRPELLARTRPTLAQAALDRTARRQNVQGAFVAGPESELRARRVLLADDVFTTGSTVEACAAALKRAGAASVLVVTAAHG